MAEFDPDAYIKSSAAPAFDPDAYIKGDVEGPPLTREMEIRRDAFRKMAAERPPGYEDRFADEYSLGLIRPLAGVKSLAEGKYNEWFGGGKPATAGEYYRGGYGAQGDYVKQARENTPGWKGNAVDLAGGVASGLQSSTGQVLGRGAQIGQAAIQGGVGGAARNADDPVNAATGAATGAAIDATTTGVLGALLDRFTRAATKETGIASRGGSSKTLADEGSDVFTKLDNAGIHFGGKETPELANKANAALANSAYSRNVPDEINKVMKELNDRVSAGAMTYGDVRKIQTQLSNLKAHNDPGTRALAGDISRSVDDFMDKAKPTMPASSIGTVGPNDLKEAKDLWRRSSQASEIEQVSKEGVRRASDPADKMAGNFEKYSDQFNDRAKYNPNKPDEMGIINKIVEGSPKTEGAAKTVEKYSNNLMGYGSAAALSGQAVPFFFDDKEGYGQGASGAGTAALALGLLGKAGAGGMRHIAEEAGQAQLNNLLRKVVTGSVDPSNIPTPRDTLAQILARGVQNAGRSAGNYASSFVDKDRYNTGMPLP